LIKHVFIDHIANQEQNDQPPIMKKYKCNWEKYTAGHFDKQDSLKNHVKKHTGEEKDIFLKHVIDKNMFYQCTYYYYNRPKNTLDYLIFFIHF
jgi:hypothetical protein